MLMIADAIRLALFPAMMAFAASSDLFTMTISNRVTLMLVGGFFALAAITGINAAEMLSHVSAGCVVLSAGFGLFARGISVAATPSSQRPRPCGSASITFCPMSSWLRCWAAR
jgi:hypothetical protein